MGAFEKWTNANWPKTHKDALIYTFEDMSECWNAALRHAAVVCEGVAERHRPAMDATNDGIVAATLSGAITGALHCARAIEAEIGEREG